MRGPRRHFTHSKVLAWVAFDRAVDSGRALGLPGPVDRWRRSARRSTTRSAARASNRANSFTQSYGSDELDASTLLIPLVGFLPADDPRVVGNVDAIQRDLMRDGFVERYAATRTNHVDGLPGGEGAFLPCSFWLVDALLMLDRDDEARALFERLLGVSNDLGLLSEEYDPARSACSATSRRRSRTSASSTPRTTCRRTTGPMHQRGDGRQPAVPEVVGARKCGAYLGFAGCLAGERAE